MPSSFCLALILAVAGGTLVAQAPKDATTSPEPIPAEKMLEAKRIILLGPEDHFAIQIPLRVSTAVNLGRGDIDITLAPDAKHKDSEEDLHLIGHLAASEMSLPKGDQMLVLHGVVPAFGPDRNGAFHASDFSIHFGSGNVTNIGTPTDQLIDTKALTEQLEALHLKLAAPTKK